MECFQGGCGKRSCMKYANHIAVFVVSALIGQMLSKNSINAHFKSERIRGNRMNKLTKVIGYVFFGGWSLGCAILYIKAVVDFIVSAL